MAVYSSFISDINKKSLGPPCGPSSCKASGMQRIILRYKQNDLIKQDTGGATKPLARM